MDFWGGRAVRGAREKKSRQKVLGFFITLFYDKIPGDNLPIVADNTLLFLCAQELKATRADQKM